MIYDHRHQDEWESMQAAVEGAVISVMLTAGWFLFAFFYVAHHYGR